MAVIDTTRTAPVAASGGIMTKVFNAIIDWNDARMTRKALSSLTARELDDIGLIPGDIDTITRR